MLWPPSRNGGTRTADALSRKVARRLLPFLFLCYVAAFLDRVNVGFAALTMNRDLGLSASAFGAGLFFLGYGPTIVGRIRDATGRFDLALLAIAGLVLGAGLLTLRLARGIAGHAARIVLISSIVSRARARGGRG